VSAAALPDATGARGRHRGYNACRRAATTIITPDSTTEETMDLRLDTESFEERQELFIKTLIEAIMVKLVETGLPGEKVEELTAHIAFSIASIIDDTSRIESDGVEARPYLTFRADDDALIHCGENAYSYEFVTKILKQLFP
jgi:hypothetical protein